MSKGTETTAAVTAKPKLERSSSWSRRCGASTTASNVLRSLSFSLKKREDSVYVQGSVPRKTVHPQTIRKRIPQPKLVHFPAKMEVRSPTATASNPASSDYRSHFNHPSTSGAPTCSLPAPSTMSAPAPANHSCPLTSTSSPDPTPVPAQPQIQPHQVQNQTQHHQTPGPSPAISYSNLSLNAHSPSNSVATNGHTGILQVVPEVIGNGNNAETPRQSITILSSKGTESLKEMVQCPICLDRLHRPKMLPCQHAFCFLCLQNSVMKADTSKLRCAKCRTEVPLPKEGISGFPSSIHLQNILDLLESDYASMDELLQCCSCQTVSCTVFCEHCKLSYCPLCMARHVEELAKQLGQIADQLEATVEKIGLRYQKFEASHSELQAKLKAEAGRRVRWIRDSESQLYSRMEAAKVAEEAGYKEVVQKVQGAVISSRAFAAKGFDHIQDPSEKIRVFMQLHQEAGDALSEATTVGNTQITFDPDAFSVTIECRSDAVDEDTETSSSPRGSPDCTTQSSPNASLPGSPTGALTTTPNQAEVQKQSADAQSRLYRSKSFLTRTRLGSGLVQRPSGVAVSPWSSEIFVVSMDNHKVLTFDSTTGKFLRSFGSRGQQEGEFLCPFGIALSSVGQEILITDKWKHCIHVFDKDGNFQRQIGMKGRSAGHFRSPESICIDNTGRIYVCDTCNHRIQVLDHDGIFLHEIGTHVQPENAFNRSRSMFQEPTGIAVTQDAQRVVVCDFGSHRIHVFSTDGEHLFTFGQKGALKGQFVHPECVAVDSRGFILVGDSGNGRVQICRPDGRHVRTFGNKGSSNGQFSWISSIAVTANNEVVVSDFKNHSVQVF